MSFPTFLHPSFALPRLLHDDIVLTRLGTCNLFVPRPVHGERELYSAVAFSCYALSFSLDSLLRARKIRSTCSQWRVLLCACISALHHHCRVVVWSAAPARNNFLFPLFFFFYFLKTQTRALHLLWVSRRASRGIANKIMARFGGRSFVSAFARPVTSSRLEKIRENMYVII